MDSKTIIGSIISIDYKAPLFELSPFVYFLEVT